MNTSPKPARRVAYSIIFVWMLASWVAFSVSATGNSHVIPYICGGTLALTVLLLVVGSVIVAASKPPDSEQ